VELLFKMLLPVLIVGVIMLVIGIWGNIHNSLGKEGQEVSNRMGEWALYGFFGIIILLAIIFGSSSVEFGENLPEYLQ
jgi:hypothetical protein